MGAQLPTGGEPVLGGPLPLLPDMCVQRCPLELLDPLDPVDPVELPEFDVEEPELDDGAL
ncbi:MAG TPA: hypothetical protein VGG41_06295 [Solirubrobacteraceae bacterium]